MGALARRDPDALAHKQKPARETFFERGLVDRLGRGLQLFAKGVSGEIQGEIIGGTQWLGPGQPIRPVAPPEVEIRRFDYPVGYDYTIAPRAYEAVSFDQLQALADGYDLVRIAIETRKAQLRRLPWQFRIRRTAGMTAREAHLRTQSDQRIAKLNEFFAYPNREHSFRRWVNQVLENMLVLDAVAILPRFTKSGDIFSFDVIDGSTIARKIDPQGRTPTPPQVAYQQIIHGLPARNLVAPAPKLRNLVDENGGPVDQLFYYIQNPRPGRIYGFGPVERVILTVNIALRRQVTQLEYYTEGGRPDVFAALPKDWVTNPESLAKFQGYWDSLFQTTAIRRQVRWVPEGSKFDFAKHDVLKDAYDEWLWLVIAANFQLPKTPLVRQMNRATAQTESADAEEQGLQPVVEDVQDIVNFLVSTYFGYADIEFTYGSNQDADPVKQAQVRDLNIRNGTITVDEGREDDGRSPRGLGEDYWIGPQGPVLIDEIAASVAEEQEQDESGRSPEGAGNPDRPMKMAVKKKLSQLAHRRSTELVSAGWRGY